MMIHNYLNKMLIHFPSICHNQPPTFKDLLITAWHFPLNYLHLLASTSTNLLIIFIQSNYPEMNTIYQVASKPVYKVFNESSGQQQASSMSHRIAIFRHNDISTHIPDQNKNT